MNATDTAFQSVDSLSSTSLNKRCFIFFYYKIIPQLAAVTSVLWQKMSLKRKMLLQNLRLFPLLHLQL